MTVKARQAGVSLVELIVAIVLIAAASAMVMAQLGRSASGSARDVIATQSTIIAGSYLELVASRPFADPDGTGGEPRNAFDDIGDYNGLRDVGARDATGIAIAGLGGYDIRVTVRPTAALTGVPAADARRIDVTVRDPAGSTVVATAYRVRS
jgi:MSHA pilin protein MshD